ASIDYTKRHGLLEEINQQVQTMERNETEEAKAKAEEQKKKDRLKLLETVRGEEIKPRKPEKRHNFDANGMPIPLEGGELITPTKEEPKKPERGSKAPGKDVQPKPGKKDADGVKDE